MPKVTCYVAELNVAPDVPLDDDLLVQGKSLTDYILEAAMLDTGTPAINLTVDPSRRHNLRPSPGPVGDDQLQQALGQLLQPANRDEGYPVGLILVGDLYNDFPNAYGVMFDKDDLHEPAYGPRQGCAVFLEKIRSTIAAAEKGDQDFRDFVAYTAIHELGHVFNLWHVQDSFMAQSPEDYLGELDFADIHKEYLRHAGDPVNASYVLPGGSKFNDRGPLGHPGNPDDNPFFAPADAETLKLEIKLSHQEFWHFEPVELDVILSVPDPESGAVTIPDEIDPGYARFEIWITRPDGERRRYRPSTHFCGNPNKRQISKEEPFTRDISIFRQSGGYTFPMAGKYEIQAVLRLSPDKSLASNTVECEVLRAMPASEIYSSMREVFSPTEAVRLLRYRSRTPSRTDYLRLKRFADSHSSIASAAAVHYSLGRALVESSRVQADTSRSERLRKLGLLHLENAANHTQLSSHRCTIAERLLDELGAAESSAEAKPGG
jgi:hypothetical protein